MNSKVQKYTKKPVTIEAIQWTGDNFVAVDEFITVLHSTFPAAGIIEIPTLEGTMQAIIGDWIIKGVAGEFYPCKPDIFAATYDLAATQAEEKTPPTGTVVNFPGQYYGDTPAATVLRSIADTDPHKVFVIVWPHGEYPTYHSNTSDLPVLLMRTQQFIHKALNGDFSGGREP